MDYLLAFLVVYLSASLPLLLILLSRYQQSKFLAESRLKALKIRQAEKAELKSQLRQTTSRLIDSDYRLWDFQQDLKESKIPLPPQWKLWYPQMFESPVPPAEYESQSWQSGYPQVPHPDTTEALGR